MSRRPLTLLLVVGCPLFLAWFCFGKALFEGEQFAYRDAAHFYYPLYERVQAEWRAGRWPLWAPEENAGMPLMGNPTAAVLYPGKLIYAALPYAWGARAYVVAHVLLAFVAMLALLRSWRTSWVGATLGGLTYAFSGPILFQYCNIIYLVGAAWAPLGFLAADQWLRLGSRRGLLGLSAVLAMEVLGGDPEIAYLTGVAAGAYAVGLAVARSRASKPEVKGRFRVWAVWFWVAAGVVAWVVGTLAVATAAPGLREEGFPPPILPWMPWVGPTVAGTWGVAGFLVWSRWRRARGASRPVLFPMLAGLAGAAVLAGAMSAAQLFPVLEFTGQSGRAAGEGPHDAYPFSLPPWRLVEMFVPNLFGTPFHGNRSWLSKVPPMTRMTKVWVPTLYAGGLALALAAGAARFRGAKPWRAWLTAVGLVSLLGAFGEYTGPLLWARTLPPALGKLPGPAAEWFADPGSPVASVSTALAALGPPDAHDVPAIRHDFQLRDGDGSFYWLLSTLLPGFRQFRFPSKLLTLTMLSLAALAGVGWDDLMAGDRRQRRRTIAWGVSLTVISLAVLAASPLFRPAMVAWLEGRATGSPFGPLDAAGAVSEMQRGLAQGAFVLAAAALLAWRGTRWPAAAAAMALALSCGDLAVANARYVLTIPQRYFEGTPEALALIQEAERDDPSDGPYRVHRMPMWNPVGWTERPSDDRVRDFVEWERGTLQPKYGINDNVHFTMTIGVAELYDYEWFFGGFPWKLKDESVAASLGAPLGTPVVYFPRRSFDIWTTRYFVAPYYPNNWTDEQRAFAAFLPASRRVFPAPDAFKGEGGLKREEEWARTHDYQILRNLNVFPRAWVVHGARRLPVISGMSRAVRQVPMQEIVYSNDPFWSDPNRTVYDPKSVVWVEPEDAGTLARYLPGAPSRPTESVTVTRYESDRIELDADLETPGVVVLAEVYYPGWELTINGEPAPIYRANRMMRGAAVEAGHNKLVFTYRPFSFRAGLAVSAAGLAAFAAFAWRIARGPSGQ